MAGSRSIDLSVVIVNYNVRPFLEQCLRSLYAASSGLTVEVFVVDNASRDDSAVYIRDHFPSVQLLVNDSNLGFGRANNQALQLASGRYLLILNPDTLLSEDTLTAMIDYLDRHPEVGAAGPKILDRYGRFDRSSKRGLPTPWVAFCKLAGLSALFPRSRLFGRYELLYLDPDQPARIDALAGSAMFVRREAYAATGGFDEDYFMYGEDIDWSYRIARAGWKVHYAPVARIIHFRGESTRRSDFDRDRAFYGAMQLFVAKHFHGRYPAVTRIWLALGIRIAEIIARVSRLSGLLIWPLLDWSGLFGVLLLARYVRWGIVNLTPPVAFSLLIQSLTTVLCIAAFGGYRRRRGEATPLAQGVLLGFFINSSFTFFFPQYAYSRFVTLFGLVVGGSYIGLWRLLLHRFLRSGLWRRFFRRKALVVGCGRVGREVASRLVRDSDAPYLCAGFIDPDGEATGSIIDSLPVLGASDDLARISRQEGIEEIIFAPDQTDYNRIVAMVGALDARYQVNFKVITSEALTSTSLPLPQLTAHHLAPRRPAGIVRKVASLLTGR